MHQRYIFKCTSIESNFSTIRTCSPHMPRRHLESTCSGAAGEPRMSAHFDYVLVLVHVPERAQPQRSTHRRRKMLGPNRGRHFLLSGRKLGATELLAAGIVAEVLPRERLLARATELAHQLAGLPPVTMRNTRLLVTQQLKRRLLDELGHGLALQGLSIYALIERPDAIRPRYIGD